MFKILYSISYISGQRRISNITGYCLRYVRNLNEDGEMNSANTPLKPKHTNSSQD